MTYTESDIQKAVAAHYRVNEEKYKYAFFSVVGGSVRVSPHIGKRMKEHGVRAGVHDLIFLMDGGKSFFIELKTKKGTLSQEQKDFHALIKSFGFESHTVKAETPGDAIATINGILWGGETGHIVIEAMSPRTLKGELK